MKEITHGTLHSYNKLKCRCALCTNTAVQYQYNYRKGVRIRREKKCGTITMYNLGCRCEPCKKAQNERYKRRRKSTGANIN